MRKVSVLRARLTMLLHKRFILCYACIFPTQHCPLSLISPRAQYYFVDIYAADHGKTARIVVTTSPPPCQPYEIEFQGWVLTRYVASARAHESKMRADAVALMFVGIRSHCQGLKAWRYIFSAAAVDVVCHIFSSRLMTNIICFIPFINRVLCFWACSDGNDFIYIAVKAFCSAEEFHDSRTQKYGGASILPSLLGRTL